jgi:hypothetical protein
MDFSFFSWARSRKIVRLRPRVVYILIVMPIFPEGLLRKLSRPIALAKLERGQEVAGFFKS